MKIKKFQQTIWSYYRAHKRDFPWRRTRNPYRILVSEIMLQQTQTERVVPKYREFLKLFPTLGVLADADTGDVLRVWQGLGYNRRAIFLKKCAEVITQHHAGRFPKTDKELQDLPGIGQYTASAVVAFAYNQPAMLLETNIRRVYIHFFFPKDGTVHDKDIAELVEKTMDRDNPREWYYALMDYGAYLAKQIPNPNRRSKHYVRQSKFEGSHRQLRGKILKALLQNPKISAAHIAATISQEISKVKTILKELKDEGFEIKKPT